MKRVVVFVTLAAALGAACKKTGETTGAVTGASGSEAAPAATASPPWGHENAPDTPTPKVAAPAPAPLARPLLWSATKDGKTTYFLGTMHAGIDAEARMPPAVWTRLADAKAFAMEADLEDPSVISMITPTGRSLRQQLGEAYWKKLEDALGSAMAAMFDGMPPMLPASALALRGLPSTPPMDKVLAERVKRDGKPVVFLEPVAHQIALLNKWMDVKALKMMLDELAVAEQRSKDMLAAYTAGDEQQIVAIADGEKATALRHGYTAAEYDLEMKEMLYDRNAAWIAPIERLHAEGGGFVAVGALHLVGPHSVLERLAARGYQVKRVTADAAEPRAPAARP